MKVLTSKFADDVREASLDEQRLEHPENQKDRCERCDCEGELYPVYNKYTIRLCRQCRVGLQELLNTLDSSKQEVIDTYLNQKGE